MHCPCGNATDPIWRLLASSDGISSWTLLKPQRSYYNPNPLANQLWCIDFLTPPTPLILPHWLLTFLESLMPLKNWCSSHARWFKSSLMHSIRFCGIFSKFQTDDPKWKMLWWSCIFLCWPHMSVDSWVALIYKINLRQISLGEMPDRNHPSVDYAKGWLKKSLLELRKGTPGIEPGTSRSAVECSTTELYPRLS